MDNVKDGSIVLMHENYSTTAEAVEILVPELINRGYVIVSVSELMKIKGITMTSGNVYSQAQGTNITTQYVGNTSKIECENMTLSGQYSGKISSPFSGVALYTNNNSCKITKYFTSNTHSFSLRGCSNNSNMAKVDLRVGGQYKGTFYFGGSYPAVYTINNVNSGNGNQEIELVVTSDNGQWDSYINYL